VRIVISPRWEQRNLFTTSCRSVSVECLYLDLQRLAFLSGSLSNLRNLEISRNAGSTSMSTRGKRSIGSIRIACGEKLAILAVAALHLSFASPVWAQGVNGADGVPKEPGSQPVGVTSPSAGRDGRQSSQREQAEASFAELVKDSEPSLGPETIRATLDASRRYAAIAERGGWPRVKRPLPPNSKGRAVETLRVRLAAEGDLPQAEAGRADWDTRLADAVKRFQFRLGLPETGVISGKTLRELNVSAAARSHQLASTARRLAAKKFPFQSRYVVVNIPAATVETVEDGKVRRRYTAIVGDVDHPSPEVVATIVAVNLNPSWTVPVSIIKKELMPKMRRDPAYLSRARLRVFDRRGREVNPRKMRWSKERAASYTFRQDPGAQNSLGSIRIFMPNKYAVYLHDTPKKKLFGRSYRFLSHGCVRVEDVYDLAAWLLKGAAGSPSGQWDEPTILETISQGKREDVRLAAAVPVIWTYMTGWASADGVAHFRDDVYGMDKGGRRRRKAENQTR
jgi:murein L,D-transpeptidase YcbB/YkuD